MLLKNLIQQATHNTFFLVKDRTGKILFHGYPEDLGADMYLQLVGTYWTTNDHRYSDKPIIVVSLG